MSAPQSPNNSPPATSSTDYPPPTVHSDFSASTTQVDPPSTHRCRHALAFFSVSGARALLRRVLPGVRHSQQNTNLPTDLLEQHMSQPLVSLHGLANTEVPAVTDNQVCFASVFLRSLNTKSITLFALSTA